MNMKWKPKKKPPRNALRQTWQEFSRSIRATEYVCELFNQMLPTEGEEGINFDCVGPLDVHHKMARGMGGSRYVPSARDEVMLVCRAHHDWIERNPDIAFQQGWKVSRNS
jgi:hypothetical protein